MSILASDCFSRARAVLNDNNAILYGDSRLLPYLVMAYDELQQELALNEVPVLSEVSTILDVAAGAVTVPAISDMVKPVELGERADGTNDLFEDMTEKPWEPEELPGTKLRYWVWREEQIQLIGATTNREVKVKYKKSLSPLTGPGSIVAVSNAKNFLGVRCGALAARYIGENPSRADQLDVLADEELQTVLGTSAKDRQSMPVRRQRNRYRR